MLSVQPGNVLRRRGLFIMYRRGLLSRIATRIAPWVALIAASVAWTVSSPVSLASASTAGGRCNPVAGVTATALGTLGGPETVPFDLNDRGVVVGVSDTDIPAPTVVSHAFRWERGVMTDMTPAAVYGVASDVNDRGQILFRSNDDEGGETMFIWSRRGTTELPGGAFAINDRGDALLGNAVWKRGTVTGIPPPDADHWISASGLGNGGHVFGYVTPWPGPTGGHPPHDGNFVWLDGTMTVVRVSPHFFPLPIGVDRAGRLLIQAYATEGTRALLSNGGGYVELPPLAGTSEASTTAGDINDRGEAVGSSVAASGEPHAVLWRDGEVIDLHTLGTSSSASAIGPRGHVAGTYVAGDGETRGFLWWCGRMTDLGVSGVVSISHVNARGQVLVGSTLVTPTFGPPARPLAHTWPG
jgi:probable HAF family extracellular repeat protein